MSVEFGLHLIWRQRFLDWRLHSLHGGESWHRWLPLLFGAAEAQVAAAVRKALLRLDSKAALLSGRAHGLLHGLGNGVRWRNSPFRNYRPLRQVLNLLNSFIHSIDLLIRAVGSVRPIQKLGPPSALPGRENPFA